MKINWRGVAIAVASVFVAVLAFASTANAKSMDWRRWDADIVINKDGTFTVKETYELQFIGGTFSYGYRNILIKNFTAIKNVSVTGDGVQYQQSSSNAPNTFEWDKSDNKYIINWYYPKTSDATRVFTVQYDVVGGIAVDEKQGDKFFWAAVGDEHDIQIDSSTVTITAPPGTAFDKATAPAYFGASAQYKFSSDGRTVTVAGKPIPASTAFEVGLRFPHGYIPNQVPAWQTIEARKSVNDLIFGVVAAGLLVVGVLGVFMLWSFAGRDPSVGVVPEYLTEPPSDLPPGLVGTLIDERADLQDIIATLVDLARRGVLDMQEQSHTTFGIVSSSDFIFHRRTDYTGTLRKYETLLIAEVFGGGNEIALSDLKNKFYSSIPKLQSALYEETVREGLFPASPQSVRGRYMALGVVGLVVAIAGFFCSSPILGDISDAFICPFLSLGIASIAMMGVSGAMPTKSRKGAEEAAKWRAFKEYLLRTEKYVDLKTVTDQFDKYLPFAIAFGLDRTWIGKFSRVADAPMPSWYYPSVIPYTPGMGRTAGSFGSFGGGAAQGGIKDLSGRSAPSLDGMSGQMFSGLNSMSNGLFTMLNTTASTFTSVPHSSSSGGFSGGGFSGGGFSGGGGGGGGGAGFG